LFRNLDIQRDSQEVTKWLIEDKNCDLKIVTAYSPIMVIDKVDWLSEFLPHIDEKNIIFMNDKGCFNGDFLIDDGGHNLEAFKAKNPSGIPITYDAPCPYNHYLRDRYPRVHNWKEVRAYFEEVL
jgi:5'(3')-deoxyribonucleotidase